MNDFIDFQHHQRVFGILGLIHGPSIKEAEIVKANGIMNEFKDKFSYDVVSSILVFEPTEKINDENIVQISNKGDLKVAMDKLTVSIVENMSDLFADINQRPALPSPCGIED